MKLLGILIPKSNSQFNTINVKGGVLWTTNYWLFDLKIIYIGGSWSEPTPSLILLV